MKTLLSLILCLACLAPDIAARTARDFFADEPGVLFASIPRTARLDMCDYYDAGQHPKVENQFGNDTRLDTLTDNFIRLHTSEANIMEIRLMPFKNDTIIAVIETALTPAPDSRISFYNRHWYRLREIKPFKAEPTINDFFLASTPKATRAEILARLPFTLIEYSFGGTDFATLTARHSLKEFLSRDEWQAIAPYLRPALTYRIDGSKIKPAR